MNFELWLDESGDFVKDILGKEVPSIVGGLLVPAGTLTRADATDILNKGKAGTVYEDRTWVHGTDIKGKTYGIVATKILRDLNERNIEFVIFENREKVQIVNSDLTYLHILSEGIIQLFQWLAMQYDDITLHILAARRERTADDDGAEEVDLIKAQEYTERLQEKLDLGYAKRSMRPNKNKWRWTFTLGSARKDQRLMLADIVCHSWFRRNGNKFTDEQRETVHQLYRPHFHFTAVEQATVASINRHLSEGAIGEALYEWLIAEDDSNRSTEAFQQIAVTVEDDEETILTTILHRLKQLPDFAQQTELTVVLNHFKTLIQLERDFVKAKHYLLKIQDEVIPIMKEEGMNHYEFFFDVHLMLFTNATHQGDLALSDQQMKNCRIYLAQLTRRWESFGAVLNYFVRESVHLLNSYDFSGVIKSMNQLENLLENTIELFPLALQDELNIDVQGMNADILGKVLGTRLQAHCFLSRKDKYHLEYARTDSNRAIEQFVNESDLSRQYQYRSQLECEAGNFEDSLQWLGKSVGVQLEATPAEIVENILAASPGTKVFGIMHYSRAMAEAAIRGELDYANRLYEAWQNAKVEEKIVNDVENVNQHPYEIILWKLGTYLMITGSTKAAIRRYKEASDICTNNPNSLTLYSISLAITAEEVFYLSKQGKKYNAACQSALKRLWDYYTHINSEHLPQSMREFFKAWEGPLGTNEKLDEPFYHELFTLSRTIGY